MAQLTNTELSATIDEVWDLSVMEARYAESVLMPRIMNKSDLVKKSGDTIHIPIKKRLVVGTVSASGGFTPDAQTLTQVDVAINTWKYVSNETLDQTEAQSYWSPESDFPKDAGKVLAEDYDSAIAALYSGFTSNIVGREDNPSVFDDDAILSSMLKLADRNIPRNSLSFILPPIAFYLGLFKIDRFTDADKSGLPKNVLTSNFRFPLLGVPAYESTLLSTVGAGSTQVVKGLLLHKEALAIAMQLNNKFKRADATAAAKLSTIVVMESLYGVKTVREDHGVVINIRNS